MTPPNERLAGTFGGTRVLVTGHTGFVGSWLSLWLAHLGAEVSGLALAPTEGSLYLSARLDEVVASELHDVRDAGAVARCVAAARPDFVFHLAAQPMVMDSYVDPVGTMSTNVMGTVHVLDALRSADSVRACVVVTSDKCYAPASVPHREDGALGGRDPYSASKAAAELVTASFRSSFFSEPGSAAIASARAGNILGGGDWGEHRIVPDFMRAAFDGSDLEIRRPGAVRPWQHVLDVVHGYLVLATAATEGAGAASAWNFGPDASAAATVDELVSRVSAAWERLGNVAPTWNTTGSPARHEEEILLLDSSAACEHLGWHPRLDLNATVEWTVQWYASAKETDGFDARDVTLDQIRRFTDLR